MAFLIFTFYLIKMREFSMPFSLTKALPAVALLPGFLIPETVLQAVSQAADGREGNSAALARN